jgi:hypothetical protein
MSKTFYQQIKDERKRQDILWGIQNHDASNWALILSEEVGEAIKEANDVVFRMKSTKDLKKEIVQVAAVCVAWLECMERKRE